MFERVQALGDAHPPIRDVLDSVLLLGISEDAKLGPEGAMRYETALSLMVACGSDEALPEINDIVAASAAMDSFALHLLHKIARIEQMGFKTPQDMIDEFKLAIDPVRPTKIEYIPLADSDEAQAANSLTSRRLADIICLEEIEGRYILMSAEQAGK